MDYLALVASSSQIFSDVFLCQNYFSLLQIKRKVNALTVNCLIISHIISECNRKIQFFSLFLKKKHDPPRRVVHIDNRGGMCGRKVKNRGYIPVRQRRDPENTLQTPVCRQRIERCCIQRRLSCGRDSCIQHLFRLFSLPQRKNRGCIAP